GARHQDPQHLRSGDVEPPGAWRVAQRDTAEPGVQVIGRRVTLWSGRAPRQRELLQSRVQWIRGSNRRVYEAVPEREGQQIVHGDGELRWLGVGELCAGVP